MTTLPTQALQFTVDSSNIIAFVARGSGIGITFELWKRVDAVNWNTVQVIGHTYASEQECNDAITAQGGEVNFIKNLLLAAINAVLAALFPGAGTPTPPANVVDRLNAALANSFTFYVAANGSVQIKAK